MIQQRILEKASQDGSNWAVRKLDGDLRISENYKIGIYHQKCSDLFLLEKC